MADLKKIAVQFPLPFVLLLPDTIEKESKPEGYEEYVLAKDRIPAMLRFKKQVREHPSNVGIATMDTKGVLSYSLTQVWFDHRFFEKFGVTEEFTLSRNLLVDSAITYLNRFLDLYRDTTDYYWINPVNRVDIPYFEIFALYSDEPQKYMIQGSLGTGIGLGTLIDEDGLRKRNEIGYVPDKIQSLIYKVQSSMDEDDYWSAALLTEIAFEAKVARCLRISFKAAGLSESDIDSKLLRANGIPLSITKLIKDHIFDRYNIDLNGNSPIVVEYRNWYDTARAIRNDIAHGKTLSVSKKEAEDTIENVKRFLNEIEKLMPDQYQTRINYVHQEPMNLDGLVPGMVAEFKML